MRLFCFRLALALGMTVDELLNRISSQELSEWMAYERLEPFGQERADLRAGIVASTIANVMTGKNSKKFSPKDFMPDYSRRHKTQTQEEMLRQVEMINRMMGGKDLRKK